MGLSAADLAKLPLDDVSVAAIREAAAITSKSALRRQRQLIGKLMARQDWQAVRVAFDELRREDLTEKARFKEAERWRDRLIKEGRPALEAFLAQTGGEPGELPSLVSELGRHDDAGRRTLARQIFRQVHAQLTSGMRSGDA